MLISAKELQKAGEHAKTAKADIDLTVHRLKNEANSLERFHQLIERLSRSWRDEDPGKYGIHAFFVRSYELEPMVLGLPLIKHVEKFWIAELADDPEEIKLGRIRHYVYRGDSERIAVPLGDFGETRREPCPQCHQEGVVIGTYCQTYDSPDGDYWEKALLILCPHCLHATTIAHQVMDGRF